MFVYSHMNFFKYFNKLKREEKNIFLAQNTDKIHR